MATLNVLTESDYDYGIPEIWNDMLRFDAARKSITKKFEGAENSMSAIIRQDDPSKGPGDTFHFQTLSQLVGKGRSSSVALEGYEEKPTLGQFNLTVALKRHAVAYKDELDTVSLYKAGEWARPQLARWFARRMDFDCFYQYLTTDVQHVLYAGNATAVTNLKKLDGTINSLTLGSLKRAHSALESIGAEPIMVERKSGEEFPVYGAFITAHDFANLKLDPAYAKANELAGLRGEDNPIFTGAVGMIDGMMIYVCRDIRGDGSPLRPEAKIYGAHAADATTIVVGSDTSGIIDYTEFFPSSGTLSIVNESGAVEYVTYSGKGTYRFTGCTRAATYGDVTSTASAYTGGATNREYVTLGHMQSHLVCFGAQSMMRAFSKQMAYTKQERDYGNEIGVGIKWIGGHKATKNSNGVNRGYVVMKTCGLSYDVAA